MTCPIWETDPSEILQNYTGDSYLASSPRAGGTYELGERAAAILSTQDDAVRAKLTTWIVDQHRAGIARPRITDAVIKTVQSRSHLSFSERVDRFFEYMIRRNYRVGETFHHEPGFGPARDFQELCAWTECVLDQELPNFIRLLGQMGLVQIKQINFLLSAAGMHRLDQTERGGRNQNQAFIAMWFAPEMSDALELGIKPAIRRAGYDPIIISQVEHNRNITDEIISSIKRSHFIVADFTCSVFLDGQLSWPQPRGGVYFEAGYAYGLGIEVIWTCRKDQIDHVHFDTRQFAHILWESPAELEVALFNRIIHVVGEGLLLPGGG